MKNANSPAMPTLTYEEYKCSEGLPAGYFETKQRTINHNGLTKREMFAMHAPDCPDWFEKDWKESNCGDSELFVEVDAFCEISNNEYQYLDISSKGKMALIKAWRYAYADMMLCD